MPIALRVQMLEEKKKKKKKKKREVKGSKFMHFVQS